MRNFDFLKDKKDFADLYTYCRNAEEYQIADPAKSALSSRQALEYLVKAIYMLKGFYIGEHTSLFELVEDQQFKDFLGEDSYDLLKRLHYIRKAGNIAAHIGAVPKRESFFSLINLHAFVGAVLLKLGAIDKIPAFENTLIPSKPGLRITVAPADEPKANEPIITKYKGKVEHLDSVKIRDNISEAETRKLHIDQYLEEAGWQVVEEKKTSVDPIKGKHQAELYADCLEKKYGTRPVIYYTNGFVIKIEDGIYPERALFGFHTQADLELLIQQRAKGKIKDLSINKDITDRSYQITAVTKVCEHFNSNHRRALLVMATGTGKTRVAISLVDVLTRNNWIKNVLFLADRTALVNQAHRAFAKLLPNMTYCVLSDQGSPSNLEARIILSTYQTMINYVDAADKTFSVGRFDLIIIDEAHRSVFGKFGSIFSYFDSLLVELTATPREDVDRSTYQLFGLEEGHPNCEYELSKAVADGYLVNYNAFVRSSKILREGIKYVDLSDSEKDQLETVWEYEKTKKALDPDEDYHRDISNKEIFKYIYNKDTIDKVLKDLMTNGQKVEDGDKIGKTIIFASSHKHAKLIVDRVNALYPHLPNYCELIDNYVNYAQDLINKFEERNKLPQIAVSVDMLDVGIDVPDILNLVFFKVIKSKIKFLQMIGRGTRLSENIFGANKDKKFFNIYDWCSNIKFFSVPANGKEAPRQMSLTERIFGLKIDIACKNKKSEYQSDTYSKALHNSLKEELFNQVKELDSRQISVREKNELISKYKNKDSWAYISPVEAKTIKDVIAPILPIKMADENAKRFDVIILQIELSLLNNTIKAKKAQKNVITIARALQERASIGQVNAKMNTINEVLTSAFWENQSIDKFERIRVELRDLIQFIVGADGKTFTINVSDVLED